MFDDPGGYLWLIPFLPLLASAVTAFAGPRWLRDQSHWPCILGTGASCILSLLVFLAVSRGYDKSVFHYTWFQAGNVDVEIALRVDVEIALRADGLTAIMLVTVTFVGTLIAVFSVGYMHGDPGYPRFFAAMSLFLFSMTGLVMADNFILLYAFWEGVGLCSYLLIGYYYARPSAAAAARKAFLVTRIGDVGLLLGILLLWSHVQSLSYDEVFRSTTLTGGLGVGVCLLLFCGAVGKSAQFPLHVWLPDAMEGPTPVSALIHAATMVTAGVYLVARCMPLFVANEIALIAVACIGGVTALLGALMALTQTDLKRVLAYSTISQLGFMFLALGAGMRELAEVAVVAAIFHLFTHAFFKALLFLASGSVMHAMGNVIDMRRFGGLRHVLKTTHWTFLCGAAALAGVPLISGFWSKDEILTVTWDAADGGFNVYALLFFVALFTAGLTAFYTFRAYFLTFWGDVRIPEEAGHHAHESPPVMLVPLQILAIGALFVGIVFGPTHIFANFLHEHWGQRAFSATAAEQVGPHLNWLVMLGGTVAALTGIGVAYWIYVREPGEADRLAARLPVMYELSRNRFYMDELYTAFIVRPLAGLARVLRVIDQYIVDGLVDLFAQVPRALAALARPMQNGLVQFYALLTALGVGGFLLSVLMR